MQRMCVEKVVLDTNILIQILNNAIKYIKDTFLKVTQLKPNLKKTFYM